MSDFVIIVIYSCFPLLTQVIESACFINNFINLSKFTNMNTFLSITIW